MKKIYVLFLLIVFLSCSHNNCDEDKDFKEFYYAKIDIVSNGEKIGIEFNPIEKIRAVIYLCALTGIESKIDTEYALYHNKKDFEIEKNIWEKWYNENKCLMTIEIADSIAYSHIYYIPPASPGKTRN